MQHETDRVRSFTRRALVVGGAQVALFGALGFRLYHLQVQQAAEYALQAEDNAVNQRLLIPPRGRILDRLDRPLAVNVPTYRVRVVREQSRDLRGTLERLATLITIDSKRIDDLVAQSKVLRPFIPITVREDLSWDEVALIGLNIPELPGVELDSGLLRDYPYGETLAHVLGYVGPVTVADQQQDTDPLMQLPDFRLGKNGIERSYDRSLRGSAGRTRVEVNAIGREIRELERQESEPGVDIRLTLDLELQKFCEARLSAELAACAVMLDIKTGGILALSSVPSYDPRAFTGGLSQAMWHELSTSPRTPLVDKCIRGQYPPGSTFKLVTAMAGLETGAITTTSEIGCSGVTRLGSAKFHCWREHGHGRLALTQAIAQSCDCFFYEVARRVGIDPLAAVANKFGLGSKLGIDLPGEQPGLMPTSAWKRKRYQTSWQKGETLVCGIGQGFVSTTPLQLATMTARMVSGRQIVPTFVHRPDLPAPEPMAVSRANLNAVLYGMREAVQGPRGTARTAQLKLPGIEIGGKTGTSQVRRLSAAQRSMSYAQRNRMEVPWLERDHALFVCFAPFDEPRYAMSVIVEHGLHGGTVAAEIARDVMRKALELHPTDSDPLAPTAKVADRAHKA